MRLPIKYFNYLSTPSVLAVVMVVLSVVKVPDVVLSVVEDVGVVFSVEVRVEVVGLVGPSGLGLSPQSTVPG